MAQDASAVIFDLDGVLIDSSRFHFEAWCEWAREAGLADQVDREWFRKTFGLRNEEILGSLYDSPPVPEEVGKHSFRKEELFRNLARGRLEPLPGARRLVEDLHEKGVALAVGTSTPPENLEMILEELELRSFFPVQVTSRDVRRGKPDPEVFLVAAAQLGVPPERCLVIEDAEAGVEAARAAGMASVAVVPESVAPGHRRADRLVASLEEITADEILQLMRSERS